MAGRSQRLYRADFQNGENKTGRIESIKKWKSDLFSLLRECQLERKLYDHQGVQVSSTPEILIKMPEVIQDTSLSKISRFQDQRKKQKSGSPFQSAL